VSIGEEFEVGVLEINLHGRQSYPIAEILYERRTRSSSSALTR
jgi:hypothetical protein